MFWPWLCRHNTQTIIYLALGICVYYFIHVRNWRITTSIITGHFDATHTHRHSYYILVVYVAVPHGLNEHTDEWHEYVDTSFITRRHILYRPNRHRKEVLKPNACSISLLAIPLVGNYRHMSPNQFVSPNKQLSIFFSFVSFVLLFCHSHSQVHGKCSERCSRKLVMFVYAQCTGVCWKSHDVATHRQPSQILGQTFSIIMC